MTGVDWRELLRNRWVWVAGGGGALLGLVVYLRRRGSSSSSTGGAEGVPSDAAGYTPAGLGGTANTTGSDIASQLSQYAAAQQAAFDQLRTDVTAQIAAIPTGAESGLPPASTYLPPVTVPTSSSTSARVAAKTAEKNRVQAYLLPQHF